MNALLKPFTEMSVVFVDDSDAELEAHIRSFASLMESEYAAGNTEAAHNWMQAMQEAQHQVDLATLDRIERQDECYFDAMGEFHAGRLNG